MDVSAGSGTALEETRDRGRELTSPVGVAVAVAVFTLAGLAFSRAVGFLPAGLYTTDYVFLAEGAHRIALGQTPHVDYSAPVGPLMFWLAALARRMPVLGPDAFALNVLMWAVVAFPTAIVATRLRSAWTALAFVSIAALAVLSPFNLEEMTGVCEVNYNGIYNRYGAALLFATFVAGFLRPRQPLLDGALFAWLLAAMLLTKVTYGVAGAAFLALACLFSAARLRAAITAVLFLIVTALTVEMTTGFVSAYLRDVAAMGRLNAAGIIIQLRGAFWSNTLVVMTALALVAALAREPLAAGRPAFERLELPLLAAACAALTLWTESQSTGGAGLVALSALAFVPSLRAGRWERAEVAFAAGVVLLTAGLFADQVLRRGWCLLDHAPEYKAHPALTALAPDLRASGGRLGAAELAARLWRDHRPLVDEAYHSGFDFHLESYGAPVSFLANALLAHEAAERLRALGLDRPLKYAMTLSFVDDFSPLLGLSPAPGTKLALDPYRTIGPPTKAEAAAYLGPIDAAFERTCAAPLHARQIADFFRPALEDAFTPVVLTPCWTVHLRNAQPR